MGSEGFLALTLSRPDGRNCSLLHTLALTSRSNGDGDGVSKGAHHTEIESLCTQVLQHPVYDLISITAGQTRLHPLCIAETYKYFRFPERLSLLRSHKNAGFGVVLFCGKWLSGAEAVSCPPPNIGFIYFISGLPFP
jgi:hypothetical protein